jgi:hypothetical protein
MDLSRAHPMLLVTWVRRTVSKNDNENLRRVTVAIETIEPVKTVQINRSAVGMNYTPERSTTVS